jgi:hypothetical protein
MYAARKQRQEAKETVHLRKNNLKFFHIMKTYFTDIQLPPFLYASENARRRRPTRGSNISPAVAHVAVFEDPSSPYFNLEDRYWNQKYAKAARDITYCEKFDYFPFPAHCYDRIDRLSCPPSQLRVLEMRRRHDLRVLKYVEGKRESVLPPRGIFNKITPIDFLLPSQITYATARPPSS